MRPLKEDGHGRFAVPHLEAAYVIVALSCITTADVPRVLYPVVQMYSLQES